MSSNPYFTIPGPPPPRYIGAKLDSAVLISLLMMSGFLAIVLIVKTYFIYKGLHARSQARQGILPGLSRGGHALRTENCLDQATVDSFDTFAYSGDLEKGSNECVVCLGEFVCGNVLKQLPCDHMFHIECIVEWLSGNITCPMCRINLRPELELTAVQVTENRTENESARATDTSEAHNVFEVDHRP